MHLEAYCRFGWAAAAACQHVGADRDTVGSAVESLVEVGAFPDSACSLAASGASEETIKSLVVLVGLGMVEQVHEDRCKRLSRRFVGQYVCLPLRRPHADDIPDADSPAVGRGPQIVRVGKTWRTMVLLGFVVQDRVQLYFMSSAIVSFVHQCSRLAGSVGEEMNESILASARQRYTKREIIYFFVISGFP